MAVYAYFPLHPLSPVGLIQAAIVAGLLAVIVAAAVAQQVQRKNLAVVAKQRVSILRDGKEKEERETLINNLFITLRKSVADKYLFTIYGKQVGSHEKVHRIGVRKGSCIGVCGFRFLASQRNYKVLVKTNYCKPNL